MFEFQKLQIFADGGGDGGTGAAPAGAPEVAASEQSYESRLEALGVPKDKIRKRSKPVSVSRSAVQAAAPEAAPAADDAATGTQDDAAEEAEEKKEAKKPTWDELMADPDYNKQMQQIVTDRLKKSKAAEAQMSKLAPALEVLGRYYGVDAGDLDAIAQAVNDDNRMYESKADELGVSLDVAKHMDQLERSDRQHKEAAAQAEEQRNIALHLEGLQQEAEELKKTFPGFDLRAELNNPTFRRMTAPGSGLSVADAYYAVHRKEIQAAQNQVVAQRVAEKMSNSIQSNAKRPTEAGASPQAPTVSSFDPSKMNKQQREDLRRRIREAAAKGTKLYPGQ